MEGLHLVGGTTIVSKIVPDDVLIYVSACLCIYNYHVLCRAYELMLMPCLSL
jgi:hypothetical protein